MSSRAPKALLEQELLHYAGLGPKEGIRFKIAIPEHRSAGFYFLLLLAVILAAGSAVDRQYVSAAGVFILLVVIAVIFVPKAAALTVVTPLRIVSVKRSRSPLRRHFVVQDVTLKNLEGCDLLIKDYRIIRLYRLVLLDHWGNHVNPLDGQVRPSASMLGRLHLPRVFYLLLLPLLPVIIPLAMMGSLFWIFYAFLRGIYRLIWFFIMRFHFSEAMARNYYTKVLEAKAALREVRADGAR